LSLSLANSGAFGQDKALKAEAPKGPSKTQFVLAPYYGQLTNELQGGKKSLDMKGLGTMYGIYGQVFQPKRFLTNVFFYGVPDINYSSVNGVHFIFDGYIAPTESGKYVVGVGYENISLDMDAKSNLDGLDSFTMDNQINYYYLRAGRYFNFKGSGFRTSVLPYAGYAYEDVKGEMSLKPSMPPIPADAKGRNRPTRHAARPSRGGGAGGAPQRPFTMPTITNDLSDYDKHWIGGLNLSTTYNHFLNLQLKYLAAFKEERSDSYSAMVNFYMSRNFGVSYRFKLSKYTMDGGNKGSNTYHMGGVAYVF
jgi:hypothetical protein